MAKASKKNTPPAATEAVTPPVVAEQAVPLEPVQLTIADLQLLGRVIDLASRRGAFQGNELTQVGATYDKLTGFLAYVESAQATEAITPEVESEAATEVTA